VGIYRPPPSSAVWERGEAYVVISSYCFFVLNTGDGGLIKIIYFMQGIPADIGGWFMVLLFTEMQFGYVLLLELQDPFASTWIIVASTKSAAN
jgi:hypothetical protein